MFKTLRKLKNDFALLTFGTVIGSMIKFFYSVYSKKLVDPSDYGIFVAVSIIATYMNYIQLGTLNAYNRDYPQLLGKGEAGKARRVKNATLTYLLIAYFTVVLIAEIAIIIIGKVKGFSRNQTAGYAIIFVYSFLVILNSYATFSVKMENKFNLSAVVYIVQTLGAVVVGLIAIRSFGYIGLYVEGLVSCLIGCVLLYKFWLKGFRFTFDVVLIRSLLVSGIPLLINNLIWTVVGSIDKFVILGFMDTTTLGFYSIATMAFSTMVLIPQTMSNVFYIKVNREYGKTSDKVLLIKSSQKFTLLSALCTGVICLGAFFILPVFVDLVMPNYKDGVTAAQIIILGIAIYSSTLLYSNLFTILREHKSLLVNSISLCIFNIIFSVLLVLIKGRNIDNVALGTSISYALYSILLVLRLKKITNLSVGSFFFSSWLPVLCAIVPCILLNTVSVNNWIRLIIAIILCFIAYLFFYGKQAITFLKNR